MKDYFEMANSVLKRRDAYRIQKRKQIKNWTATAACCCLCGVLCIGVWQGDGGAGGVPTTGTVPPIVTTTNITDHKQQSTTAAPPITATTQAQAVQEQSGPVTGEGEKQLHPDVSAGTPLAPAKTSLTQQALYETVGNLLPDESPAGFWFEEAFESDGVIYVRWARGLEELTWRIRDFRETDESRVAAVTDTKNYDLSLYPIPRAESVPDTLREIVNDPIFLCEELTPDAVYARAYRVAEQGDTNGYRMQFSVKYGEKLVVISAKGVSPDWLYEQLAAISTGADVPVQDTGVTGALMTFDAVWGGSFMNESGQWVVLLTEDTAENRSEVYRRNPTVAQGSILFQAADYSLAYLTQLMANISKAMGDGTLSVVTTAALREDTNRVEVTLSTQDTDAISRVQSFDTLGGAIVVRYGGSAVKEDMVKCPAE